MVVARTQRLKGVAVEIALGALVVALAALAGWLVLLASVRREVSGLGRDVVGIGRQLEDIRREMGDVHKTTATGSQSLGNVYDRLARIDGAANQILTELTPNVMSLRDLLRAPAARGPFGEAALKAILDDCLPRDSVAFQHAFRDGARVDAAVLLTDGIIPIDSKFQLDAFRRMLEAPPEGDVREAARQFTAQFRAHIDKVATYVRETEGTFPFALMYLPSEAVFYEAIVRDKWGLAEYAYARRVYPVSPGTAHLFMLTIGRGLRGLRVQERAQEIVAHLGALNRDFLAFQSGFRYLGTHLTNARNRYDDVDRAMVPFGKRLATYLDSDAGPAGAELEPVVEAVPAGLL
jgi:DNA recombination protein RmuC